MMKIILVTKFESSFFELLKLNDPANSDFHLVPDTHAFFEIIKVGNSYKIKLNDEYFYKHNQSSYQDLDFMNLRSCFFQLEKEKEDYLQEGTKLD